MPDYASRPYSLKTSRANVGVAASFRRIRSVRFSQVRVIGASQALPKSNSCRTILAARSTQPRIFRYGILPARNYLARSFTSSRVTYYPKASDYSLADIFGDNSRQDKDFVILKKSDFVRFGLADNSDWSISDFVAAFLLQSASKFREDRRIRCLFYRCIHLTLKVESYEKKSYIIILHSRIKPSNSFPSPTEFLS